MEPFKMKSTTFRAAPDVRSGEQLAIEARLRIEKMFEQDGGLNTITTEYVPLNTSVKDIYTTTSEIRVAIWGPQDVQTVKSTLDDMMEDEFCYSPSTIRHEEYADGAIYKLEIPDYIKEHFKTNDW